MSDESKAKAERLVVRLADEVLKNRLQIIDPMLLDDVIGEFAPVLEKLYEVLCQVLEGGIERRIGEHDMCRCRFCGREGHNEEVGHPYGIKHNAVCTWMQVRAAIALFERPDSTEVKP